MKLYKIKELSVEEMEKKVKDLKKDLFMIRFKMLLKQVEKPIEMRNTRRDIRRMETLIREKRPS